MTGILIAVAAIAVVVLIARRLSRSDISNDPAATNGTTDKAPEAK